VDKNIKTIKNKTVKLQDKDMNMNACCLV